MMQKQWTQPLEIVPGITIGGDKMLLIAGPCAIEALDICLRVAESLSALSQKLGIGYVFKASFDKANRTSGQSFRSIGFDEALEILAKVHTQVGVPILTDVHESNQVKAVADVADVLQIPAFLCRQTDLLTAAGVSGRAVNIKKGQFMAPEDMQYAVEKAQGVHKKVFLTERGSTFGYHNLVVDMRSLPIMRQFAPVVFDVTHSVQMPGGMGGSSGGQREFAPYLARAAAAAGVDGFFIETHPQPDKALSDGPNMIPLADMEMFLIMLLDIWAGGRKY
ncbi:MAG TPA: 3-deoxy-8-phosphooctulonate synthase [Anaerolineales bacterium]|jgi:3-deoxy-8-phosphooctulonate synthase|nr:MAG: 3-deoxy-8-phosphooctulonate synthase [Anaerolineales bacterium]WKZ56043.1 MAG: 3-deoxy-8-phosphooctulonate synthase [Anaerolineales bacterium]GIK10633.1 MAG: 2-dehydro-3-deoxyphosphooctonate aldolase [Chloroflexota bacterium]HMN00141.1 3-deoxy-8-phosphooctulonate synthase [Anaerolineales bacterium]